MKIVSLHIVAFGKLKNVELKFKGGLNVIKQVNSFGKTTVAGFIRAMLYGFSYTRVKGATDVSHFAPWDSTDKFGGSIVVEHDNETYRIERFFGATAKQETLRITNEKNGREQAWSNQPGEVLLGLTAESYDRSAYFPQEAVTLETNENIDSRLANLVEDGAEDYDKVQEKLRAYKKNLRYERGLGGEIYELECKKRTLAEQLNKAQNAERRAEEIDKRLVEIAEEKEVLTKRHAEYSEQLTKLQVHAPTKPIEEKEQVQPFSVFLIPLCIGVTLAVLGIIFLVLGIAKALGIEAYIVGAGCLALGLICIFAYYVLVEKAKQQATVETQISDEDDPVTVARNYVKVLSAVAQQLSDLSTETGRLSEERKSLVFNSVEVMDQLLTVEEQRLAAQHRYEVADMVTKLLEQAKDNLSSCYLPELCERCGVLLQQVTESELSVVVDRNFTISIREKGQTKPISEFSRGIREVTLLCFRVALSELLYDKEIPFVIIDDAFVNFDEYNFIRATTLLKNLSTHAQIIYFTCHNRTGNLLK